MARLRSILISKSLPLWFALSLAGATAGAQQSQSLQEWTLQNVRAAWCVHFLMDSTAADKELPKEFRTVRAADFPGLSPALKNLIAAEPEFQGWVPAQWCSFHYDQTKIGDQTLGSATPELEDTQFLGAWLIGAVGSQDPPGPPAGSTYFTATLRTPNWRMIRLAETSLIRMDYAEPAIGKVPEGRDDRYRVEMGRTIITWDGHLAGDSAISAPAEEQTWLSLNSRGARIRALVKLTPAEQQNVVGTLQVTGNDPLAKSLRASPIRMVGPLHWGGTESMSFVR